MNQLGRIFHVEDNGDDADPLLVPFQKPESKIPLTFEMGPELPSLQWSRSSMGTGSAKRRAVA
jgi:hypothetical protein